MAWVAENLLKVTIHMIIFQYNKRTGKDITHRQLMKLLWDFDSNSYKARGISWTGAEYYRAYKDFLSPWQAEHYLLDLHMEHQIEHDSNIEHGYSENKYKSIIDPYHEHFVDARTMNRMYRIIDENDATQGSYDFIVKHTEPDEHVPLYVTYVVGNEGEVTPEVRKWAKKIINAMEKE